MEIKFKDKTCKLKVESVNIEFQIHDDSSFTLVSSERKLNSPGEYEFEGLHTELATSQGLDFKKIYIANILTTSNRSISFVSSRLKLGKDNMAMLANSDVIIANTEFIINNESSFGKFNPFYVVGLGAKDDERFIKLFSIDTSSINNLIKIDEKSFSQDSDYITKYILIK